ncbi:LuxR family transcriptional regulator [Nocardioides guangzhouensis]|uniref:LuxR family transcriptional regulator n=1 Tax=Nocardioides guangzhouensis TaxID=2497878 RepID=A0A4Q4ZDG0_9ACTN|nr:helix-turn-helix transcriptional regulator [Nocardioides guangzhouensis]RYP85391.1 LuxR family transcriptional regulator [Nocardioides guangzhouensis]
MPDVLLSDTDQAALRALVAAEPVPGTPLPASSMLDQLARLIPCDAIGMVVRDASGSVVDTVVSPRGYDDRTAPQPDALCLVFRTGPGREVQLWLDRRSGRFCPRDAAMLRILAPALERLLRDRPDPRLPDCLTLQERRVLDLVAAGWSNPEIAERMCVATSTVRKHLEHAYRKLGVGNRHAAIALMHAAVAHPPKDSPVR